MVCEHTPSPNKKPYNIRFVCPPHIFDNCRSFSYDDKISKSKIKNRNQKLKKQKSSLKNQK